MAMLMCNCAWMKYYEGITETDYPINGGEFIAKNGYGHEVINFQKNGNFVYGYVQARNGTIDIDKIGEKGLDYVDDILVVWRAKSKVGSVVIGWYKNARVYRHEQEGNNRRHFDYDGETYHPGYLIRARAEDAFLIPVQQRFFPVPVTHKGFGSQTFVSFLAKDEIEEVRNFKISLENYIGNAENGDFTLPNRGRRGNIDTETKSIIERSAINCTVDFYVNRGYDVESVESDNIGYDLAASNSKETLHIEVKGTSVRTQADVNVILTPNEYKTSKKQKEKYRICIVINALENPEIFEFTWDRNQGCWFSEQSLSSLDIAESTAANLRIIS